MKKFYFLLLLGSVIAFSSCDKSKEVVGPQGPAGVSGVLTQGSISGKINGNRENGDTINESFNYNIYTTLEDSKIDNYDGQIILVYRRGIDGENFFRFNFYTNDLTEKPDSSTIDLDFQFLKSLNASEYLRFGFTSIAVKTGANAKYFSEAYHTYSKLTISNYSYSPTTGNLKFDYLIDLTEYENTSGNPATVKGTVDVNVKKEVYKTAAK